MRSVKLNKGELINALMTNRKSHKAQFELAFEGYRKECAEILERQLDLIKKGRHVVEFHEYAPADHTEDYDRTIAMLNMSVDNVIELTAQEFECYVQDKWHWKQEWIGSNMKYTNR